MCLKQDFVEKKRVKLDTYMFDRWIDQVWIYPLFKISNIYKLNSILRENTSSFLLYLILLLLFRTVWICYLFVYCRLFHSLGFY